VNGLGCRQLSAWYRPSRRSATGPSDDSTSITAGVSRNGAEGAAPVDSASPEKKPWLGRQDMTLDSSEAVSGAPA
jgi:hypothetical protein